jgi:hypothetical protein
MRSGTREDDSQGAALGDLRDRINRSRFIPTAPLLCAIPDAAERRHMRNVAR